MKLIIAEKKSVAEAIAAAIGVKEKKNGYMEGLNAIVSWCVGHLVETAPPGAYNERFIKWRWEDLPIFPEEWKYTVRQHAKAQMNVLETLMKKDLVEEKGRSSSIGRPILYGTTRNFLFTFGFESLDDLPELEDVGSLVLDDDLEGLELPRGLADPDQLTLPIEEQ